MADLKSIPMLTQMQRQNARDAARIALQREIGTQPEPKHYMQRSFSKYPAYATRIITALAVLLIASAFITSAMRLYAIGYRTFLESIPHDRSAMIAGIAMVLLAEIAQLGFSLAYAIYNDTRMQRIALFFGICIGTIIAFTGNVSIAQPTYEFAWVETLAPPALVLLGAYVLKEHWLHSIADRHAGKVAYEEALHLWNDAMRMLEGHEKWRGYYANAIKDAYRKASRKQAYQDALNALQIADWRAIAYREMDADEWYKDPTQTRIASDAEHERKQPANNAGNATNEVVDALQHADEDGPVHVACPHCDWGAEYASKKSARFALTAHLRKHPEKQTTMHINGKVEAAAVEV